MLDKTKRRLTGEWKEYAFGDQQFKFGNERFEYFENKQWQTDDYSRVYEKDDKVYIHLPAIGIKDSYISQLDDRMLIIRTSLGIATQFNKVNSSF